MLLPSRPCNPIDAATRAIYDCAPVWLADLVGLYDGEAMQAPYDHRYVEGIEHFNRGRFRDCHETLEDYWLEEHGPGRAFLQGLIQVATGYYKWELGVLGGAVRLLRNGLGRLEGYPAVYGGLELAPFLAVVRTQLDQVEKAYHARAGAPPVKPPSLVFTQNSAGPQRGTSPGG